MESHWKRLNVQCMWFLLNVFMIQNGGSHFRTVLADDNSTATCDRSVTESISQIAVDIGSNLTLSCLTDIGRDGSRVTWSRETTVINDEEIVLINDERFVVEIVEDDGGSCCRTSVTISNINREDAGRYYCVGADRQTGRVLVDVMETLPEIVTSTSAPVFAKPVCSSNTSSDQVYNPSDLVAMTCSTNGHSFSAASLDWVGRDDQIKDQSSFSTTVVLDIASALSSPISCALTCDESQHDCQSFNESLEEEGSLLCEVPFLALSSTYQEVHEDENVTFTCNINVVGYNVSWFIGHGGQGEPLDAISQSSNNGMTSTLTGYNLHANQSGSVACISLDTNLPVRVAQFHVIAVPKSVAQTDEGSQERSASTITEATVQSSYPLTRHRTTSIYIQYVDVTSLPPTASSTFALGLELIIIIVVCGGIVVFFIVALIGCVIHRRCRKNKEAVVEVNPVMAFGDYVNDEPVNLDIHFNVFTTHGMYHESSTSGGILKLDSTKRIPSVIRGKHNVGFVDDETHNAGRMSSFIPISEEGGLDSIDTGENNDDTPGQRLNYYVDGDTYVAFDVSDV